MKPENSRRKAGFTLAETLMAMIILLMVTGIVAMGVPTAANAYYKIVEAANAQILLTTTITRLRDELSTANFQDEQDPEHKKISYRNGEGGISTISLDTDGIKISTIDSNSSEGTVAYTPPPYPRYQPRLLVSDAAANKTLRVQYTTISYDADTGIVTVDKLTVTKKDGTAIESVPAETLKIKTIF